MVLGGLRLDEHQQIQALVRRCVAGDAVAWEEIVRLYNRRIYNLCYRFTGSAENAEDLTQEFLLQCCSIRRCSGRTGRLDVSVHFCLARFYGFWQTPMIGARRRNEEAGFLTSASKRKSGIWKFRLRGTKLSSTANGRWSFWKMHSKGFPGMAGFGFRKPICHNLAGNDFRIKFGTGGAAACHLICGNSSCVETLCLSFP